jgi:hypothetical protein
MNLKRERGNSTMKTKNQNIGSVVADAVPQSVRTLRERRLRTGRNLQLNLKVSGPWMETFYKISDAQRWTLGEVFERAIAALQRELNQK